MLTNPADGQFIETWRAGEESRPSGPKAKHDFVRSSTAPAYLTRDTIIGKQAPGTFHNLALSGSYGPTWVIQHRFVPAGYVAFRRQRGSRQPEQRGGVPRTPERRVSRFAGHPGPWQVPAGGSVLLAVVRRGRATQRRSGLRAGDDFAHVHRAHHHPGLAPMNKYSRYGSTPGESEFSHGPGLEPPQYEGLPPSRGGRDRGNTPPIDEQGRELPR